MITRSRFTRIKMLQVCGLGLTFRCQLTPKQMVSDDGEFAYSDQKPTFCMADLSGSFMKI